MSTETSPAPSQDALLPAEMAHLAEDIGVKKANLAFMPMFSLAILAGAFVALGGNFSTLAITGAAGTLPFGVTRILAGLTFSLGLILVIVGGAELFTGNNLIVMAYASGRVTLRQLLRNWMVVYSGNFIGALGIVLLVVLTKQHEFADGAVGKTLVAIAEKKCQLEFIPAIALGIACNLLVCLAVWLCFSTRTVTDKILAIVPPITAFVAGGFEHSVANMYFLPLGMMIQQQIGGDHPSLTWSRIFLHNLLPVTLGNIIGGALLVGLVYWSIYLRSQPQGASRG